MNNLIIGIMYPSQELFEKCKANLVEIHGNIILQTPSYEFDFTHYYDGEMGPGLKKCFLLFEKEINKNDLITIKHKITEIEKEFSINNKRQINLDPGLLTDKELLLATYKQKGFKEFIGDRVWVHKVLEFKDNQTFDFYHTFKDYKLKKGLFLQLLKKNLNNE